MSQKSVASLLLLLFLAGCAPSSLEDYQREGSALCRQLAVDLQKIHNREELARALPQIEKQFEKFVDLMIEARTFQQKHPEDASLYESDESEILRAQLQRVCALEGGLDAMEKAQREALLRLDAFERNLLKQQAKQR